MTQPHYKWDSQRQRWKPDRIEVVLIVAVVALIVSVMALGLVLR